MKGSFEDPLLGLLSRNRNLQSTAARDTVEILGLAPSATEAAVAEILAAGTSAGRIEVADRLHVSSMTLHYERLGNRIASGAKLDRDNLDPPVPGLLLEHVGLLSDTGIAIKNQIVEAAASLLLNFGAVETVRRLATLPVPLADGILVAVRALP